MNCHGILQAGFFSVFRKKAGSNQSAPASDVLSVLRALLPDEGHSDATISDNSQESPFTFPDVPVSRIQGVRAAKSEGWLARSLTASELSVAILATEPVFQLSTWFLKQQEEESWLCADPSKRPLVNLVTPRFSPVVRAMSSCLDMLIQPIHEEHPICVFLDSSLGSNGVRLCTGRCVFSRHLIKIFHAIFHEPMCIDCTLSIQDNYQC